MQNVALPRLHFSLEVISGARLLMGVDRLLIDFYRTICNWRERAQQRRHLMELPDDRLHDIGVSRAEALRDSEVLLALIKF